MFKLKRQKDISLFNISSLVALFALLCSLSGLILPFFFYRKELQNLSLINIFQLGYTTVSILLIFLLFLSVVMLLINIFIQPSWTTYFIDAGCAVVLCVAPTFIMYYLASKLGIAQTSLTLHAGAIMMIIGALVFAGLEVYRLGTLEKKQAERREFIKRKYLKKFYYIKRTTFFANELIEKLMQKRMEQIRQQNAEELKKNKKKDKKSKDKKSKSDYYNYKKAKDIKFKENEKPQNTPKTKQKKKKRDSLRPIPQTTRHAPPKDFVPLLKI